MSACVGEESGGVSAGCCGRFVATVPASTVDADDIEDAAEDETVGGGGVVPGAGSGLCAIVASAAVDTAELALSASTVEDEGGVFDGGAIAAASTIAVSGCAGVSVTVEDAAEDEVSDCFFFRCFC